MIRTAAHRSAVTAATLGIAVTLTLTGCGASDSQVEPSSAAVNPSGELETEPDTETETEAEPAPDAEAEPAPTPARFDPDGTVDENLAIFDEVNARLLAADSSPGGRAIVDNLVAAGFDRAAMEVTRDTTPIGRQADSVQFSVRVGDGCLVGQASDSGYVGIVGPVLGGSRCLIGEVRPIDW